MPWYTSKAPVINTIPFGWGWLNEYMEHWQHAYWQAAVLFFTQPGCSCHIGMRHLAAFHMPSNQDSTLQAVELHTCCLATSASLLHSSLRASCVIVPPAPC